MVNRSSRFHSTAPWLLPLIGFALFIPFSREIDLISAKYFYSEVGQHFSRNPLFVFIYNWAVYPAQIVAIGAALFFIATLWKTRWHRWRRHALLLIVPMLIGAGLITHTLLKDHWGRPRPRQLSQFGGSEQFKALYQPNLSLAITSYKSFPCGHCTMGFYFFAVALLAKRIEKRTLYASSLMIAILLGIALGVARIAQGGHFVSDVVTAALLMWLTSVATDRLLFNANFSNKFI